MAIVGTRRQNRACEPRYGPFRCLAVSNFWFAEAFAEETVEVELSGLAEDLEKNVLAYLSIADLGEEGAEASQPVNESNVRRLHGCGARRR